MKSKKEGSTLVFERQDGQVGIFDFKDRRLYKIRNGNRYQIKSLNTFFRGIRLYQVLDSFEDQNYKAFLKLIADKESRCYNIGTYLTRLPRYLIYENYLLQGIKCEGNLTLTTKDYPKDILRIFKTNNWIISRSIESAYHQYPDLFIKIIRYIHENNLQDMYRDIISELRLINQLTNDYNCEYKALLEYVLYLINEEGYRDPYYALRDLRDYLQMQNEMSRNGGFKKYPKYLKSIHDIVAKNHQAYKTMYEESLFIEKVDHTLEYTGKVYAVITPKDTQSVKQEGVSLSHCVASYIKHILAGTSQILFMRTIKEPEVSLLTIEVNNGKVNQVKGMCNRAPDPEEREFIRKFAKKRGLEYNGI